LEELDKVRSELEPGNVVIIRLTPLFYRNSKDVNRAVRNLTKFAKINGDMAILGEDRIVVMASHARI
jgi:SepF-like predicted cell division protein (DUF552 family)